MPTGTWPRGSYPCQAPAERKYKSPPIHTYPHNSNKLAAYLFSPGRAAPGLSPAPFLTRNERDTNAMTGRSSTPPRPTYSSSSTPPNHCQDGKASIANGQHSPRRTAFFLPCLARRERDQHASFGDASSPRFRATQPRSVSATTAVGIYVRRSSRAPRQRGAPPRPSPTARSDTPAHRASLPGRKCSRTTNVGKVNYTTNTTTRRNNLQQQWHLYAVEDLLCFFTHT